VTDTKQIIQNTTALLKRQYQRDLQGNFCPDEYILFILWCFPQLWELCCIMDTD